MMYPSLQIKGIKCDSCDFNEPEVKVEDYDKWLNKPCPTCGENLLTQADYDNVQMLMQFFEATCDPSTPISDDEEVYAMKVDMNGTGYVGLNIKKLDK